MKKMLVENIIEIPFNTWSIERILNGKKRATTRYKKYGKVGSLFSVGGKLFVITEIKRMKLGEIANNHYKEEGAMSKQEFISIWRKIHPRRGYNPDDVVYFHRFKEVGED